MEPADASKSLRGAVHVLGAAWISAPETFARAPRIGLAPTLDYYIAGRMGVLGRTTPAVVDAAAVFLAPELVRPAWLRILELVDPEEAAADFAAAGHDWGRSALSDDEACATAVEVGGRVVEAAVNMNATLFAAWQAIDPPEDRAGGAAHVLHQLRELRMARHLVALASEGLTPLEAIIAGPGGASNAAMFGWTEPYPEAAALAARRDRAEVETTRLSARDLEVLTDAERTALVDATRRLREGL